MPCVRNRNAARRERSRSTHPGVHRISILFNTCAATALRTAVVRCCCCSSSWKQPWHVSFKQRNAASCSGGVSS